MDFNLFGKKKELTEVREYSPTISFGQTIKTLKQQFKGEVKNNEVKFPKDLGLEHPFDFQFMESVWKGFGLVNAVVDKYVDFVVGPGFFVKTQTEKAQKILNQFLKDTEFDTLLRAWTKEALVKGTGFMELGGAKNETIKGMKVLDAKSMYIGRNDKGEITSYKQFAGDLKGFNKDTKKVLPFNEHQIAHVALNKIGDDAYGQGIVHPAIPFIDMLTQNERNLQVLMQRKANAPFHAKVGNDENPASPAAVSGFGQSMQSLNNVQEWATDHLVDIKVIETPDFGKKFEFPVQHNLDMLFFTWQVPLVLMGGNVNMAVAPVQLDAFQRRIQSIQAELEKVIEKQILQRVLLSNGLQESVEFEWGQPSQSEKNERITQITELLKLMSMSQELRNQLELDLATLMGLEVQDIKEDQEKAPTDEELEDEEALRVPGQNNETEQHVKHKMDCLCHPHTEQSLDQFNETDLKEWLDFDYMQYLSFIIDAVNESNFDFIRATTDAELKLGRLSGDQVKSLKEALKDAFLNNKTLNQLAENIKSSVKPKDLINENGKLVIGSEARNMNLARTQSTILASIGADKAFAAQGVDEWQWVATAGTRTCPICEGLHGQVFSVGSGPRPGEVHSYCRCTKVPVIRG